MFEKTIYPALAADILASTMEQENQLSAAFQGSRGVQVVFRADGIDQFKSTFEAFYPFFKIAASPDSNAFFMNTLIVDGDFHIRRHVDCSLNSFTKEHTTPNVVSVLYVQVPEDIQGGELELLTSPQHVERVKPCVNRLVQFPGDMIHGVTQGFSKRERISLVLEEYLLPQELLDRVPMMSVQEALNRQNNPSTYSKITEFIEALSEEELAAIQKMDIK